MMRMLDQHSRQAVSLLPYLAGCKYQGTTAWLPRVEGTFVVLQAATMLVAHCTLQGTPIIS